jgi:hypothetical protein
MGSIYAFGGRKGTKFFIYEKNIFKIGPVLFEYTNNPISIRIGAKPWIHSGVKVVLLPSL